MIPLGGLGSRFANEGYSMRTKPFVRVLGKEMILWLTDNLKLRSDDTLVVVYNPAFSNIKVCMERILVPKLGADRVKLVELAGPTRGAAETVLRGLEGLSEVNLDSSLHRFIWTRVCADRNAWWVGLKGIDPPC